MRKTTNNVKEIIKNLFCFLIMIWNRSDNNTPGAGGLASGGGGDTNASTRAAGAGGDGLTALGNLYNAAKKACLCLFQSHETHARVEGMFVELMKLKEECLEQLSDRTH